MSESLLHRVPLFATLPDDELDRLAATLRVTSVPPGHVLFFEGEQGDRFYVVLKGAIAIIKAIGTADERLVGIRGPGEFVGEMSLLGGDGLRAATVRVQTEAQVLELTQADFDRLLQRNPPLAIEMLRVLSTRLRESHDTTIRDLHEKNEHLAQAYAELQAAQAQLIAQETLLRELRLAREVQESMLPAWLPHMPNIEIAAQMIPARIVGGDFYDVFPLDSGDLGIAIGDVSGKGFAAALFMALTCSLLRAEAGRGGSPETTLRAVNRYLLARNPKRMFVSMIYGTLDCRTRTFCYARAGHEFPLAWDTGGAMLAIEHGHGHPLGMFLEPLLDLQRLTLPPGGTLLLFTDGVTEAMDEHEVLFGGERLEHLTLNGTASAEQVRDRVVEAVLEHQGKATQSDDMTLVVVRATG